MMKAALLLFAISSATLAQAPPAARTGLPAGSGSTLYTGNRAPLRPSPLVKLPAGAVRPEGWLRGQLVRQAEGFSGRLSGISQFCRYAGNAWTTPGGAGRFGWEEVPYWLKGYVDLGYVLGDERILAESKRWIEAVLATTRPDGWFGPRSNFDVDMYLSDTRALDLWPNMVMLYPLRTYYEATGDRRVLDLMSKYFQWVQHLPLDQYLPASWQKWRAGDQLDSLYWLYNHTGEAWLLDAARVNHDRTADWTGSIPTWHGVNLSQCFREPAQFFQQNNDPRYLARTEQIYDTFMSIYGQAPGGMFAADENARPGFSGPRNAAETCSMVEMMFSHEMLAAITGDAKWLDRAEDVAFNSLPASMTADLKGLHYLTAPNMVQLDRAGKSPMLQNGGDMLSYNPYQYRCCQHNAVMGWPYFAQRLWMATSGDGLAAAFYAPARVTAKVAGGVQAVVTETTDYPFGESINLRIELPRPAAFPLALRIPAWCAKPTLTLNGAPITLPAPEKGWIHVLRQWKTGDTLVLSLPMETRIRRWPAQKNAASVERGPLAYSLKIGERWEAYGQDPDWRAWEVYPATPWNYGLVLDGAAPKLERRAGVIAEQPFGPDTAPLTLKLRARRIPAWTLEPNGLIQEIQTSPIRSSEAVEEVTLIPMGSARLRLSVFPVVEDSPSAQPWDPNPPMITASAASHSDPPSAVADGVVQTSALGSTTGARFLWAGRAGSEEWIQLSYASPVTVNWSDVVWIDDSNSGGNARLPASWRLVYWDGVAWQQVKSRDSQGTTEDRVDRIEFEPVTAATLRLEVHLQRGRTAGIVEWRNGLSRR